MAEKGLVLDFRHKGRQFFMLPPVIIGLFEFVFMRSRGELPMEELAQLFEQYMNEEGQLARNVFRKQTQLSRSLVHEEALPKGDHTEILDWERASYLVDSATDVGVSMCACRHKAGLLNKACDAPVNVCLTLNLSVAPLERHGMAKRISNAEGLRILEECKAAGLAQTGDNVQRSVNYICNCCGCCCGEMQAIKRFDLPHAIVSSNWIACVGQDACLGCGKCVKACPAGVIELSEEAGEHGKKKKRAVIDEERCLGCGVCHGACKPGAISMRSREQTGFHAGGHVRAGGAYGGRAGQADGSYFRRTGDLVAPDPGARVPRA